MPSKFLGRDDKYLRLALSGLDFYDVGDFFAEEERDEISNRIERHRRAWKFYRGDHYDNPRNENNRRKTFVNLPRKIVDKSSTWLMGKPWSIETDVGNESSKKLLDDVWKGSDKDGLSLRMAQLGGVTGDVCLQLNIAVRDRHGIVLPENGRRLYVVAADPIYCHPRFAEDNPSRLTQMITQFPDIRNVGGTRKMVLVTRRWTEEIYEEWVGGQGQSEDHTRTTNDFGFVPFVFFQNLPVSTSLSGRSDIEEDILTLTETMNWVADDVREIIDYHASPLTLVFGARAQTMERSPKKTWSGLPINAKVENLELNSDLGASREMLELLEKWILWLSDTPKVTLGESQPVSNTSGVALETFFLPLVEKTRTKWVTYGTGLSRMNTLVLMANDKLIKKTGFKTDTTKYDTTVKFASPLPRDLEHELDIATKKIDLGVQSRDSALKQFSDPGSDLDAEALKIVADRRYDAIVDLEIARASSDPNYPYQGTVEALDSIGMRVVAVISEQATITSQTVVSTQPPEQFPET